MAYGDEKHYMAGHRAARVSSMPPMLDIIAARTSRRYRVGRHHHESTPHHAQR